MADKVRIKFKHDSTTNWSTNNLVLLIGEIGIEYDDSNPNQVIGLKIGDGHTDWNTLPYTISKPKQEYLQLASDVAHGTDIDLPNGMTYLNDGKSLEVYVNGLRMINNVDFTEVDETKINFTTLDLVENDVLLFISK